MICSSSGSGVIYPVLFSRLHHHNTQTTSAEPANRSSSLPTSPDCLAAAFSEHTPCTSQLLVPVATKFHFSIIVRRRGWLQGKDATDTHLEEKALGQIMVYDASLHSSVGIIS